jgi:hypothetical protein
MASMVSGAKAALEKSFIGLRYPGATTPSSHFRNTAGGGPSSRTQIVPLSN